MLKRMICLMVLVVTFATASIAATADPDHSSVLFKINNDLGYTVGYFEKFSASVEADGNKILSARAVIDMDSVRTHNSWHDAGLRSPLFLDAAKFPQAIFESSKVDGDQMTGTLTIKGISKPIILTVDLSQGIFTAHGSFNRHDFGINFNRDLKDHKKALGDMVDLMVELQGIK